VEIREQCCCQSTIESQMRTMRLKWFGKLHRMGDERTPKKLFSGWLNQFWSVSVKEKLKRGSKTWHNLVQKDFVAVGLTDTWRDFIADINGWNKCVNEKAQVFDCEHKDDLIRKRAERKTLDRIRVPTVRDTKCPLCGVCYTSRGLGLHLRMSDCARKHARAAKLIIAERKGIITTQGLVQCQTCGGSFKVRGLKIHHRTNKQCLKLRAEGKTIEQKKCVNAVICMNCNKRILRKGVQAHLKYCLSQAHLKYCSSKGILTDKPVSVSISVNFVRCLKCGKQMKSLRKHRCCIL